jgi:hypothetical protein
MSVTEPNARHLPWPDCLNVRDLGGYPIEGGEPVRWRELVCHPVTVHEPLRYLDTRYGGVRPCLQSAGLMEPELVEVPGRLVAPE